MKEDRTILITGSTGGLGRRTAEKLAAPGNHILVHGRNPDYGKAVVASVETAGGTAKFFRADLATLAGVQELADAICAEHTQLDILINNAGIADISGPRRQSRDGFELHFAVNYLAPFLLTHLLSSRLGAQAPSRIVNVVSAAQASLHFDDLMLEHRYDGHRAYAQSKLAEVMLTLDLAESFDAGVVTVNCLHPGSHMDTAMVRDAGIRPITSVDTGASAVVALITEGPAAATTGRYFDGRREARANPQAYDTEARRRLRAISLEMTKTYR